MSPKTFEERMQEDQRHLLLKLLSEQNAYRTNASMLHAGLHNVGITISRDRVLADLHWLKEQALVSLEEVVPGVVVATLSARGQDVVTGAAFVPGVSKPSLR